MENKSDAIIVAKEQFELACKDAQQLSIVNNFGAAFVAVGIVSKLRQVLTHEVMESVFMPLMNTKIGFRTDRDPRKRDKSGRSITPYSEDIVRDAIIDAVAIGLLPTGNQFNIISERMYPTKEGYTALLKKIGCKHFISYGTPKLNEDTADVDCKIGYEFNGEKKSFGYVANVKKDNYSSFDQIKGKAERKAKKVLYEYLTGVDFGDADEQSSEPIDDQRQAVAVQKEIESNANSSEMGDVFAEPSKAAAEVENVFVPKGNEQPTLGFSDMPDFA